MLLQRNADPDIQNHNGDTALILASKEGQEDIVRLLLQYNANPNIRDHDCNTPLYRAFMKNNTDKMELLLQYGADPYIQNDRGRNIFNFPVDVHNNDPIFGRPGRRIEESTIQFV